MMPLLAVLGLIVAAVLVVKRFLPARASPTAFGAVEVVARTPVSPKQNLMLVKLGQRLILVGVSPERMEALATVEDPHEVALLLGRAESQGPRSMTQAFAHSFQEESRAYADVPVDAEQGAALAVGGQVRGLLDKVRRLAGRREVA